VADTAPLGPGGCAHNLIIQRQSCRSAFMRQMRPTISPGLGKLLDMAKAGHVVQELGGGQLAGQTIDFYLYPPG
jgi:hypothetical protein